ncbi:hypothetical protein CDAR_375081 [Caerostris darwini]|uniref:Uncharacterized protein n=1 Tax=Caerostris darwini TaxID=1538125 RepID=A0AAV4RPA1_9ARAC|nr:hypothetical protein CDAR_375081 [Caerostris darwini]
MPPINSREKGAFVSFTAPSRGPAEFGIRGMKGRTSIYEDAWRQKRISAHYAINFKTCVLKDSLLLRRTHSLEHKGQRVTDKAIDKGEVSADILAKEVTGLFELEIDFRYRIFGMEDR